MGEWRVVKLTDIAEYINGFAFKPSDFSEGGCPIVRIEQLKNPSGNFDFYDGKIPERNWIDNGDLIFSWSASLFLKIWQNGFAYLNQHLFKVLPKDRIDKFFLKYLLELAIEDLTKMSHGSTMQHITRKELQKFEVKIPSDFSEQVSIATILTTIDQAIEKTEQLIAKYERIKTGMMQDLLTRGIDEQGNIRREETHAFKDSALGRIPVEWGVRTLQDCCDSIITYGIVQAGRHIENGVPYIRTGDMSGDFLELNGLLRTSKEIAKKYERSKVETGDIVFALRATVGKVLLTPAELNGANLTQGTAKISPKEELNNKLILWMMRSDKVLSQIRLVTKGTTFAEISLGNLKKINLALPKNKDEQDAIARSLEDIGNFIVKGKVGLNKLQKQKTALMQDLLTGKICVDTLIKELNLTP